jgi:hypothetical protein
VGARITLYPRIHFKYHRAVIWAVSVTAVAALNIDAFAQVPLRDRPVAPGPGAVAHVERRNGLPTFIWAESGPSLKELGLSPEQAARRHLWTYAPRFRVSPATLSGAELWRIHDTGWGAVIVSFVQRRGEVPIFRETLNVVMDRELRAVALTGYLSPLPAPTSRALLSHGTSLAVAVQHATGKWIDGERFVPIGARAGWSLFEGPLLDGPGSVRRVYFALGDHLEPAYDLDFDSAQQAFRAVVSSVDGRLLLFSTQTEHASAYRVFADNTAPFTPWPAPNGPSALPLPSGVPDNYDPPYLAPQLVALDNAGLPTNDPWLPASAMLLDGNNARAYADLSPPDGLFLPDGGATSDVIVPASAPGQFDWTYDLSQQPGSTPQRNASATHAFYVVNWLHDLYYGFGFDEKAGNAQASNYGRGGVEGDAMNVEVQDYLTRNNAQMSTHSDGKSPRLELFLFSADSPAVVRAAGNGFDAGFVAGTSFGPPTYDVTGNLTVGANATDGGADGCVGPLANAAQISGGIVLLANNGGRCAPQTQVTNAADAGALAVILTTSGNGYTNYVGLGPTDPPTVNLPAPDSAQLRGVLGAGTALTARVSLTTDVDRDPALDTTVVAHEWTHYLSNRLIADGAGLTNSLAMGMGEGWSDFNALLTLITADDLNVPSNAMWKGVWSEAAFSLTPPSYADRTWYFGIRRFPYSIDRTKNDLTFQHVQDGVALPTTPGEIGTAVNSEVHNTGEVWCSTLFEAYAGLLNDSRLTFDEAQRRMRSYLVASLKATPVTPDFLEARDAWLAVAAASDLADLSDFVQAFARRGMGPKAIGPDRFSVDNHTVTEDFTATATQAELKSVTVVDDGPLYCDEDGMLDVGEQGHVVVTLLNTGTVALPSSVGTVLSSSPGVLLPGNGALTFPAAPPFTAVTATAPIQYAGARGPIALTLGVGVTNPSLTAALTKTVGVRADGDFVPSTTETFEAEAQGWNTDWDTVTWGIGSEQVFQLKETSPTDHSIYAPSPRYPAATYLISPPLQVGTTPLTLHFKHRYDFTSGGGTYPDGAVLQVSTDNGGSWTDVPGTAFTPALPGMLASGGQNPLRGKAGWIGTITGYPMMQLQAVTFGTAFSGQTLQLRFALGVDANATGGGWEIDDIQVDGLTAPPFIDVGPDGAHCKNRPPTADAGPDQVVDEGSAVHLEGSATDPDNQPLTLSWTQKSGPAVQLDGGDFTAPLVTQNTALVFTLTASDGMLSGTDDAQVMVRNVNHPPVVTASGPSSVNAGDPIVLTGTASDPDGDPLLLTWADTGSAPVTIDGWRTLTATATAPQTPGVVSFTFTAFDGAANVTSAPVIVHVMSAPRNGGTTKSCGCSSSSGALLGLLLLLRRRSRS